MRTEEVTADQKGSYLLSSTLRNRSMAKSGFGGKNKPRIGLDSQPKEESSESSRLLAQLEQHLKSTFFELKINLEPFISFEEISPVQNYITQADLNLDALKSEFQAPKEKKIESGPLSKEKYSACPGLPKKQEIYESVIKKVNKMRQARSNKKVFLDVFARTIEGFPILMNRFLDEHATTGKSKKKLITRKKGVSMDQNEGRQTQLILTKVNVKNFETVDAQKGNENKEPEDPAQSEIPEDEESPPRILRVPEWSLDESLYAKVAHLASLRSVDSFLSSQSILLSTQEFLDLGSGSEFQSTFCLWNWFRAIDNDLRFEGIQNLILLGLDFSFRKTAFLMRFCKSFFLCNYQIQIR